MKNERDGFMNSSYNAGFIPQGFIPTNPMMFPNYMNDNYSSLNERVNKLENKVRNMENRLSRLEGNYQINNQNYHQSQSNYQYQTTQNSENYNGEMYMM